jgi:hypothetical protein
VRYYDNTVGPLLVLKAQALAQVPQHWAQNRPDGGARPVSSLIF